MKSLDSLFEHSVRLVFLCFFVFMAVMALDMRADERRIDNLQNGKIEPLLRADEILLLRESVSPRELLVLAELVSLQTNSTDKRANDLLMRALAMDPRLPDAHAQLAYLETEQAGRPTEFAIENLELSFWDCPYCNRDLLRWRLAYVVKHWHDIPEEVRLQAFAGADVLRWWYLDYDFLDQISKEAIAKGIAFNAYRRKIYTPVRPSEIGQN